MAFSRNRSFNNRGGFGGGRNFDKPMIHPAVCDKCKKDCEVPFRPTSGKPVYCNNCFERPAFGRQQGRNFKRSDFSDRKMFDAVCDECKNNCQVPFQPRGDKPIYCNNCFSNKPSDSSSVMNKGGKSEDRYTEKLNPQLETQLLQLNSKLDQIINILKPAVTETEEKVSEEEVKASSKLKSKKK